MISWQVRFQYSGDFEQGEQLLAHCAGVPVGASNLFCIPEGASNLFCVPEGASNLSWVSEAVFNLSWVSEGLSWVSEEIINVLRGWEIEFRSRTNAIATAILVSSTINLCPYAIATYIIHGWF